MDKDFDLIKVGIVSHFSGDFVHKPQVEIIRTFQDVYDVIVLGRWLGQSLERYEFKYPADWREAVKERFFPEWLKKRFPVKMRIEVIDFAVLYPQLHKKLHMPKESHLFSASIDRYVV